MFVGISEAFFTGEIVKAGYSCKFKKSMILYFMSKYFLCRKTSALILHRKFLIAEKNFLYRPMQAALACIFVLWRWTVFHNESTE